MIAKSRLCGLRQALLHSRFEGCDMEGFSSEKWRSRSYRPSLASSPSSYLYVPLVSNFLVSTFLLIQRAPLQNIYTKGYNIGYEL